jgi:UDP-N-acetylmuramoyl-tripeptide--D-alanyl-D-alanine ligase
MQGIVTGDAQPLDLTLAEIAGVTGGRILSGPGAIVFSSFHHHSAGSGPGSFFFALKGKRADGHDFLRAVYEAGCRGAMVTDAVKFDSLKDMLPGMGVVLVDDAIDALAKLGREALRRLKPKVVGITGSVGKTTTKEMIAAMLRTTFRVGASPGNLNTDIGLPIALLNIRGDEEIIVLEMATRGFGQIAHLCSIAPPDVAVITSIGHSHLECFGSVDGIRRAKFEIVENMADNGTAVIPGDNNTLLGMVQRTGKPFLTFGQAPMCDFALADIKVDARQVRFALRHQGGVSNGIIEGGTRGDAYNCAASIAVCTLFGIPINAALKVVHNLQSIGLRMEKRRGPNSSWLIVDCYNASPESMRNAIEAACAARREGGRVVAVLADMLELGDSSAEEHTALGTVLKDSGVDILITYGNEVLNTAQAFAKPGGRHHHFDSHEEIALWLGNNAAEGDVILLKGSRGMALEKVLAILDKPL